MFLKDMYEILRKDHAMWEYFSQETEYSSTGLGSNARFRPANYAYDIFEPNVSKYLVQNGFEVEYPDNKKFAICLTHDVDDIYPPLTHTLLSIIPCVKSFNFSDLRNQISWNINYNNKSPYMNFEQIMQLEEKYGAKSSFYFLTAKEDPRRFRYDIEDTENELGLILDKGWEVGLHGGYYSYDEFNKIEVEKNDLVKVLGKEIIGFRNHYLRFKVPDSWELLSKAGFKYDTTIGYNDMIGFRNGMCHPFRPYNLTEKRSIDILEIPLVIMDGALFEVTNSFEDAWQYTKKLIDVVETYHGVITILWHNYVFNCPFRRQWKKLYEKILAYGYEKNAWMTSGEEIYKWWTTY
jgi:peptidoglycan/xylan/chitin deacetylase (PgdA/CDA1 family)